MSEATKVMFDIADKHLNIEVNLCKLKLLLLVYYSMAIICCFLRKCSQFVRLDLFVSPLFVCVAVGCVYIIFPKDLERSRLTTICYKNSGTFETNFARQVSVVQRPSSVESRIQASSTHISGNLLKRKFFFTNTACVHTT